MQGTLPGSSAGGEQPKFCTVTAGRPVLVKFSAAGQTATDQRTRDLLVCEHLALQTLAQAGLSAARTTLFNFQGRVFLEVERFDRTPLKPSGRIGMVSLLVFDAQYVGQMDNWAATATRLAARQLLTMADANTLALLEAFGLLIANTDRHYGNISLLLQGKRWALSPVYDMLPMLYAPVAGELVPRSFAAQALQPTTATLAQWPRARELAQKFWQSAALDERLSAEFAATAQANALHVAGL
jgi:serine/threonine protein kinase HipA of HipAB toxin-antitoxin module